MRERNYSNLYAEINMGIEDKTAEGGALRWKR